MVTAQRSRCQVQSEPATWVGPLRRRRLRPEHAIDAGPADPEPACDGCRPELLVIAQAPNLGRVDGGLAPFVDAAGLRGLDAFKLALAAQVGLQGLRMKNLELSQAM